MDKHIALTGSVLVLGGCWSGYSCANPNCTPYVSAMNHKLAMIEAGVLLATSVVWPHCSSAMSETMQLTTKIAMIVSFLCNWLGVEVSSRTGGGKKLYIPSSAAHITKVPTYFQDKVATLLITISNYALPAYLSLTSAIYFSGKKQPQWLENALYCTFVGASYGPLRNLFR